MQEIEIQPYYMFKLESNLENGTREILCDFEKHTDYLILARWPELMIRNENEKILLDSGL